MDNLVKRLHDMEMAYRKERANWYSEKLQYVDRIEQLERELAVMVKAQAANLQSLEDTEAELAAEKALADRLYRVNNTFCTKGDIMDANHAYRKARGL